MKAAPILTVTHYIALIFQLWCATF